MAKQSEIITDVKDLVQDTAFSTVDILKYLNEGQSKIAAGIMIRYPDGTQVKSSPLPLLATSSSLTTSTSLPYISMPSTFGRDLYFLTSETNSIQIKIMDSLEELLEYYPDLSSTSAVAFAAVRGSRLYYQGYPSTAESLTGYYFRKPYDMEKYTAGTISFAATTNIISDAANGFTVFYEGQTIDLIGSTDNDGAYTITDVETDGSAMTVSESLTTEIAGDTVTIQNRPEGIPEHLHEDLLVNYAAAKIFKRIAIRDKTDLENHERCMAFFNAAMLDLEASIEWVPQSIIISTNRFEV